MVWNFILYLLYGLAFFTLGVAALSRDTRLSELGIAKNLWLLALFGITHGFHEWLELLEQLHPHAITDSFRFMRLLLVSISFLFLLCFGFTLNILAFYGDQALETKSSMLRWMVCAVALPLLTLAIYFDNRSGGNFYVRWMIALPGGLLSGIGLILYSRKVRGLSENVAGKFILAGGVMICYAILSGIIPSDYVIPLINAQVIMFRGICAFFIMFFTIKALSVFSLEQNDLIEERLQRFAQSEKLASMGVMAAGIAHEINNPLTNASLNLEMLRDLVGGAEKVDKKLASIDRNIVRASTIARDLLHFSRDKDEPLVPVQLNDVIQRSVNLIQSRDTGALIHLHLNEISPITGLPFRLEEVLINILINSLDACQQGDIIEITTSQHGNVVNVEISDTGHGIHPDDIAKVFDPFFTTKEIGKGTGLGLSVCYNIIKQHHGEISLLSSENGGAVITIVFPVAGYEE